MADHGILTDGRFAGEPEKVKTAKAVHGFVKYLDTTGATASMYHTATMNRVLESTGVARDELLFAASIAHMFTLNNMADVADQEPRFEEMLRALL